MLSYMDGGEDQYKKLMDTLAMNQTNFEYRLQADWKYKVEKTALYERFWIIFKILGVYK